MEVKVWETLKEAIRAYTGLSPTTFFTVVGLGILTYYLLSLLFGSDNQTCISSELEPLPPPVQLGYITDQDLMLFDGSDPNKPLLMAIKSQIYDVSQSRVFYGPGGPYALFAGRDASRALAKMSFEEKDLTSDISGLGVFELEALQDWEYKFMSKYVKVGTVKKTVRVGVGTTVGDSSQTADVEMSEHTEVIEGEASRPMEVSPKATEAGEAEGAMPVKGHAETTDGDKDHTGSISITDVNKKE